MLIRPANAGDAKALHASTCAGMSLAQIDELLAAEWLHDGRAVLLVAVEDNGAGTGPIVGNVTVRRHDHRLRRHRATLGGFVIVERARGTGLARMITQAAGEWARARGCSVLELDVRGGTHAEDAYRGLGFLEYGRLPGGLVEPAGVFDQVELYLPLGPLSQARTVTPADQPAETRPARPEPGSPAALFAELRARGICYQCHDLATGEVFPGQPVIAEDVRTKVVLATDPRVDGHTIVVWKPHRHDFTELEPTETAELFGRCTQVARALQTGLGAERVYLVSMCDGDPNHLHVQLIPRYAGQPVGSKRLVDPRHPLRDGARIAATIRAALR